MYLDYFSLKKFPFRITPDPSLFFPGGADGRGVVLEALIYAITSGEGILKVVGEVGSGKTMLCRMLGGQLSDSVEIVYLANPNLSARDIIFAIAFELELEVDSSTDRLLAMHKLQDYLLKKHSEGGTVVVFIEEAQSMPLEALEEIRLLSNLETHQHKLMQIVLFGQPELDKKLQKKSIRQLRERITHSFNLEPLSIDATREYLRFRLQAAGCPWPQLFSPQAEKLLAKSATGLSRRINILADKSLMSAYADSSSRQEPRNNSGEIQAMVLPRHVRAAIRDSGYGNAYSMVLRYVGLGLASIVVVGLLAVLFSRLDVSFGSLSNPKKEVLTSAIDPVNLRMPVQVVLPGAIELEAAVTPVLEGSVSEEAPEPKIDDVVMVDVRPLLELDPVVEEEPVAVEVEPIIAPAVEVEVAEVDVAEVAVAVAETRVTVGEGGESQSQVEGEEVLSESSDVGLVALRSKAAQVWLNKLPENANYTLQLISVSKSNRRSLEEFLQFMSVAGMLDKTFVCELSATSRRSEQLLVLHGEFNGVTAARNYMDELPAHLRRYTPYIRNTDDVGCKFDN